MLKKYFLILSLLPLLTYSQTPGSESAITSINASIPYQGFGEAGPLLGAAEYKIFYDNIDGVFDKPIFFVDGFDPNDTRTIPLLYDLLNFGNPVQNLAELVRDEGFDLVVLNFPQLYLSPTDNTTPINGGADFIQRNAFILVELINIINGMKVGSEENVVIGPSMGGLISRYALRYMEQNTMDHETRLYISFDSPHYGANVPMGIQYLFNYMVNNDEQPIPELAPLVDGLLNSAAAKQMLIDHYLAHLQGGSDFLQDPSSTLPIGAPNFRDAFQSELDAMGFPQNMRNVSIVNGSGLIATTGTPGMSLLNHTFDTGVVSGFNTRILMSINFTPRAIETITVTDYVAQLDLTGFGTWVNATTPFLATAESTSPTSLSGLDSAPGGQFDLFSFDDGTSPLITEFVNNLTSQYFDFIPTLSGLAITENNLYSAPDLNSSPFVNTFIPDANEPHVTLTDANVAFALLEILSPPLSIDTFSDNYIKLRQNPVTNEITLLSNTTFENSNISIIDITGKIIYSNTFTINEYTSIPISIDSGLYILNIETKTNYTLRTKIIIK